MDGMYTIVLLIFRIVVTVFAGWMIKNYLDIFFAAKTAKIPHMSSWMLYLIWQFIILRDSQLPAYAHLFINVVLILIISICAYQGKIGAKLFFSITYVTLWMLMEFFTGYAFIALSIDYEAPHLLGSITSLLLLFLCIKALQMFYKNKNIRELSQMYNMILMLIPLGSMFVMYTVFMVSRELEDTYEIICSLVSLLIVLALNILIFNIYLRLSDELELKRRNTVFQQQLEMYSRHLQEKEIAMAEFRSVRHDMKQSYIYLTELLEKQEYNEMSRCLISMLEETSIERLGIARTDNTVVDALINYKYSMARQKGIKFSVDLYIPRELPYTNADMCILIGNALDNAFEATIRMKEGGGYIKVSMKYDHGNLVFTVSNSFDGNIRRSVDGHLQTVKEDTKNHGIGVHSMQKIVDKYNGEMIVNFNGNDFLLNILLYAPQKKLHPDT